MLNRIIIFIVYSISCVISTNAEVKLSSHDITLLKIPEARKQLELEAKKIRNKLADFQNFNEPQQLDSYGFHGEHLPILDELPKSPRWTMKLSWGKVAKLEQVILMPAIDPRSRKLDGYGFPRRFRILKEFSDGSCELITEWMEEDCPDPSHVPLRINISEPLSETIRIDVYRGAQEGGLEFFALGEIFGVVDGEVWQATKVHASPEFKSLPYWCKNFLADQKTGFGIPLGVASKSHQTKNRNKTKNDFSIAFQQSARDDCFIDIDLGSVKKMGWLTLLPAKSPGSRIVPGYGFPKRIQFFSGRTIDEKIVFKPTRDDIYKGNPGDNAVRIPLYAREGRWLRMQMSNFATLNGQDILALGEISISMREQVYPVQSIKLKGFPDGTEQFTGALTDGLVGDRPELQMMEWFDLIELHHQLDMRLSTIIAIDSALELRWSQARKKLIITVVIVILLVLLAWIIHRQYSLQRLRIHITQEKHHTEIEQIKLRFFTHISHELRTPLSIIPAPIERAMKQISDLKLKSYLGVALKNVYELQQLVEQILDLRRIQDGKMKIIYTKIDLVAHVHSIIVTLTPLAEEKGVKLVYNSTAENLVTSIDPEAIKRVLGNLIANAIKFTPSGGRIVVSLSVVQPNIRLSVEDSGYGIGQEDLPNIFGQHYRGESSSMVNGSGIGLALVKEVVDLHGGKVKAESPAANGQGSKFTVELPIMKGASYE